MTDFSDATFRTAMVLAVLVLSIVSVVCGQTPCTDDRDCPSDKYCYNVSSMCVNFTQCSRYNRVEGPTPARQSSQCGACSPGHAAEVLSTGVRESVCTRIMTSKETQTESDIEITNWPWHWLVVAILAVLVCVLLVAIALKKFVCTANRDKLCRKMMPWSVRPSAPPQDEATYRLRNKTYSMDEERPPMYSSVIQPNVDKNHLVNAAPSATPDWVNKPHYDHDFNDNVADGAAIPIRTSSTNLQMDLEEEEETNPSSWTPGQLTVELPSRPFARFGIEQQENVLNNVLLRENCSPNSSQDEEGSSDEAAGVREEPSGSRSSHGDIFCAPNVQINQTITLNIGKKGTK